MRLGLKCELCSDSTKGSPKGEGINAIAFDKAHANKRIGFESEEPGKMQRLGLWPKGCRQGGKKGIKGGLAGLKQQANGRNQCLAHAQKRI